MKPTWRELVSTAAVATIGFCSVISMSGCQSWSPSNWAVPSGSRVPPPPTGSYQHQGAYYNNPTTGTPAAPIKATTQIMPRTSPTVVPASATSPMNAHGSMPATNLAADATSLGFLSAGGQVNSAGYTDNGSRMAEVVPASSLQPPTGPNASGPSGGVDLNAKVGEGPNLQWR